MGCVFPMIISSEFHMRRYIMEPYFMEPYIMEPYIMEPYIDDDHQEDAPHFSIWPFSLEQTLTSRTARLYLE